MPNLKGISNFFTGVFNSPKAPRTAQEIQNNIDEVVKAKYFKGLIDDLFTNKTKNAVNDMREAAESSLLKKVSVGNKPPKGELNELLEKKLKGMERRVEEQNKWVEHFKHRGQDLLNDSERRTINPRSWTGLSYEQNQQSLNQARQNKTRIVGELNELKDTINKARETGKKADKLDKRMKRRRGLLYVAAPSSIAIYEGTKALQNYHDEKKVQKALEKKSDAVDELAEKLAFKLTDKAFKFVDDLVGVSKSMAKKTLNSADEALQMTARRVQSLAPNVDVSKLNPDAVSDIASEWAGRFSGQKRKLMKNIGGKSGFENLVAQRNNLSDRIVGKETASQLFGYKPDKMALKAQHRTLAKMDKKIGKIDAIDKDFQRAIQIGDELPGIIKGLPQQQVNFQNATNAFAQATKDTRKARIKAGAALAVGGGIAAGVNQKKKKDQMRQMQGVV